MMSCMERTKPRAGSPETSQVCRVVVARHSEDPRLRQFVGREMLRGAFAAVASAGPNQQAELLHLARDILAIETPFPAAPRQVSRSDTSPAQEAFTSV